MLPGERPAVGGHEVGGLLDETAVAVGGVGRVEVDVEADVQAAVAEVPVGQALHVVRVEQRVEVAQVVAQPLRRHGRVLPSRVGGSVAGRARGQAGAVLADLPQRAGVAGVGDDERVGVRDLVADPLGGGLRRGGVLPRHLDEHPRGAARQVGDGLRPATAAHDVDDARVDAFCRNGAQPLELVGDVAGGIDVGEAEDGQAGGGRVGDQTHPGLRDDGEGALGADEHAADVATTLGREVLEGIAGDLSAEAAELGADRAEVVVGQLR